MSLVSRAIIAFENAPLPDFVRKSAVSFLVERVRRDLRNTPEDATRKFAEDMTNHPIATYTALPLLLVTACESRMLSGRLGLNGRRSTTTLVQWLPNRHIMHWSLPKIGEGKGRFIFILVSCVWHS